MRTPKQTEASRANGAKSKGPVTPQGKINSSRNSTRHGMFADTIVLEAEEKSQFLELLDDLFEEHQPRTRTETMLVETIAAARWRQERIWGMQKIAFDYDVSSSASLAELNPLRAVLVCELPRKRPHPRASAPLRNRPRPPDLPSPPPPPPAAGPGSPLCRNPRNCPRGTNPATC